MQFDRQIMVECYATVSNGVLQSIYANLVGLAVVAIVLVNLAPWQVAIFPLLFRLSAILFTHWNGLLIRQAIERNEDLNHLNKRFLFGTFLGGLSWASLLSAVEPADFLTLSALALICVMTAGLSMITLIFAPLPRALTFFVIAYMGGLAVYFVTYYSHFGISPLLVMGFVSFGILTAAAGLSLSAQNTARTNVENARLSLALEKALAAAERLSNTDSLTGLSNRRAFQNHVELHLDNMPRAALVLLDLDFFKKINDSAGHAAGDAVLQAVARVLEAMVAPGGYQNAMAARIGGEEFAIFIPSIPKRQLKQLAENLRRAINGLGAINWQGKIAVSASIGIAMRNKDETLWQMQRRADNALYAAKNNGRNRVDIAA